MLDRKEAQELAERYLAERSKAWFHDVRLILEECFVDGDRFIGPYNSVGFLDHGDEMARLAGNYPVLVDLRTGECDLITEADLNDLRERGLF
ncbi:hypothetical protein [Streptomyces sp. UNOC14_S4]|uniref:hypothetical protein n=1 Tax=Streptomyces sp. UNOC14_S4 TaxID=2872340 RepID=UPI001E593BF8|nr:hypothetical protein [Streptomyces sp. UNOC14_S4]MCC3770721.1 hypothetical protein [Streptomyces sp. UNOC14_S4]